MRASDGLMSKLVLEIAPRVRVAGSTGDRTCLTAKFWKRPLGRCRFCGRGWRSNGLSVKFAAK
jgi:hypothetical protein